MNDVYYFSHDSNARNDEKILMLRADFGWAGYGLYWALIEMMFETKDTCLHHDKIKGIAINCNIDITLLQDIINAAIKENLFKSDDVIFWSETLRERKAKLYKNISDKSNAGKKGMEKRWSNRENNENNNNVITENEVVITENNKEKKVNKIKGNKKKDIITEQKIKFAEFVSLKQKEYDTLFKKHGKDNTQRLIEILDNYKGSSGKTYASDYRAILNWVEQRLNEEKTKDRSLNNKKQLEQSHDYDMTEIDKNLFGG